MVVIIIKGLLGVLFGIVYGFVVGIMLWYLFGKDLVSIVLYDLYYICFWYRVELFKRWIEFVYIVFGKK